MKCVIILALLVAVCNGLENGGIVKQIVNGYEAGECEFPHMAYLLVKLQQGGYAACGGALIDAEHILTAAHCVNNIAGVTAYLGHANNKKASQVIKGLRWAPHDEYVNKGNAVYNDIGLIRLEKPATPSPCVNTIALPRKNSKFHGTCIATGWGKLSKAVKGPAHLRKTTINIIPTAECHRYYYGVTKRQHICVGDGTHMGSNICSGDSGGPLMCKYGKGYVVAGVASYVFDCDSGSGVYANVAGLKDWVVKAKKYL